MKHRYVYFTGKSKKKLRKLLKYPVQPYPKGNNTRYVLGEKIQSTAIDIETGVKYYD